MGFVLGGYLEHLHKHSDLLTTDKGMSDES